MGGVVRDFVSCKGRQSCVLLILVGVWESILDGGVASKEHAWDAGWLDAGGGRCC